ncbi:AAA family ATPase, partial [Nocardiopsis tropica]|nr:AAA family ATPase [Nocardiopsis tropica]
MILSILATVAVLAAIAVIAAALALAETVLVYIALGLAGASVLLLLGGMVQGRIAESRRGRPGTDGLGKSSVPTGAATPAATAAGPHVVPEYSGRVPVPAQGPVREAPAQDTPVWAAADDAGHGEPEYDVPRWQTPTAHEWPEPDTTPAGGPVPAGSPAEADPAAPASEARTDG